MPLSQEIERIFKLRAEFKECRKSQNLAADNETNRVQEEPLKIAELIKKIKE